MDDRLVYVMGGILAALVAGGIVLDRVLVPQGTTGTLHEVLPAARARAASWAPRAALVAVEGRDLVDGRSGAEGAWEFIFADPDRPGRTARVTLGRHLVALREQGPDYRPAGGPYEDGQFADTRRLARRLVAYGMRARSPATFSLEATRAVAPVFRVRTAGRRAAQWWLDARSGDLLDFRPDAGK